MKTFLKWLFGYSNDEDSRIFDKLNDALAKGEVLSAADWNKMIILLHRRLIRHERDCQRKGSVILIMLFLIFALLLREELPDILNWLKVLTA